MAVKLCAAVLIGRLSCRLKEMFSNDLCHVGGDQGLITDGGDFYINPVSECLHI